MTVDLPQPNFSTIDVRQQREILLAILCDFLTDDNVNELGRWCAHVGFDLGALSDPSDLCPAWLGHYRRGRLYDVDQAVSDYLSWLRKPAESTLLSKAKVSSPRRNHVRLNLPVDLGNLSNDL